MDEVVIPRTPDGRRSSAALGRAMVADALRAVDPAAADAALAEADWRRGYLRHFRALVEAGLGPGMSPTGTGTSGAAGYDIAEAGLAAMYARMRVSRDGSDVGLAEAFAIEPDRPLRTVTVIGSGKPDAELVLPYRGELLRGDALHRRLDAWTAAGTIEPSCAEAVREVAANPDWLDLSDQRLVVLGAAAEMGPLPAVLGWGGTVVGVDLPRPDLWARIGAVAQESAGRLIAPVSAGSAREAGPGAGRGSGGAAAASGRRGRATLEDAGADLLTELPAVAQWLLGIEGRLILGNYVYAPGADYVRVSAAVDALSVHLRSRRADVAMAFLATPTDVFAVPGDAVAQSDARYRGRSRRARLAAALSGGRLLAPNYPAGADPGINDSLVAQQGPNYALAKRIHRWRASIARRDGVVSLAVAPPSRTRSVLSNRLLAAAYAAAHLFGVEVFEPATANKLMAVLLVHQLRRPRAAAPAAWHDEAIGAAHGGLWRTPYQPRSALGLAAIRGLPAAMRRT
ncbi:MAG TPA: hypothetical protein VGP91_09065 [Actinoplanes sp.]|nr:hypothetical protein [Actinoplanes sp.]